AGAVVPELERVAVGEPAARLVRQLGRRRRGGRRGVRHGRRRADRRGGHAHGAGHRGGEHRRGEHSTRPATCAVTAHGVTISPAVTRFDAELASIWSPNGNSPTKSRGSSAGHLEFARESSEKIL